MQFQRAQENSQGAEARGRVCGMVRQEMAAETHDVGLRPGALDLGGSFSDLSDLLLLLWFFSQKHRR